MEQIQKEINRIDNYQQKHAILAFPLAVWKKYSDDEAGNKAALITYYGFLSLFPLLIVFLSVINMLIRNNAHLQQRFIAAAFKYFPILGNQLQNNIHTVHKNGLSLTIGLVLLFIGTRGIANALQHSMNHLWRVKRSEAPGFPYNIIRGIGIIIIGGGGFIVTAVMSSYVSGLGHYGFIAKALLIVLSFVLNSFVFLVIFRLATAPQIRTADLALGAVLSSLVWQILQIIGSYLILHEVKNFDNLYGTFALVLGLLFWISIQAQATLYMVEANIVRARKLSPMSLLQPPA